MRFHTMAWFYSARGQLVHINFLQFDHNTPNRFPGPNFGGTDIESFAYQLNRETLVREKTIVNDSPHYGRTEYKIPYTEDVVMGTVSIGMKVNYFITEFLGYLTKGESLSKIVVRQDIIEDNGRTVPYMQYTFKECQLFEHETKAQFDAPQTFNIKFTYCCAEIHCYDGNLFATHKRCIPTEPDYYQIRASERSELYSQEDAARKQEKIEATRLAPTPVTRIQGAPVIHRFDVTAASEFNGEKIGPGDLDDVMFHIVEEGTTTDALMNYLYDAPSQVTQNHFLTINKHVSNGIAVPGQVVLITPPDTIKFQPNEWFYMDQLNEIEAARMSMEFDTLDFSKNFVDYGNLAGMAANGISFGTTYFQRHTDQVQRVLKELQNAYSKDFRMPGGTLRFTEFQAYRIKKFEELNSLITKSMTASIYGGIHGPRMQKKLSLNPRVIEHGWRVKRSRIVPTLSEFYKNTANFKGALSRIQYIGVPLEAYSTYSQIEKACLEGEEACTEAKYVEWSGFAGALGIGAFGSYVIAAGALTLVVGISATGLVAAGIVGGAAVAGGVAFGYAGDYMGKKLGKGAHDIHSTAQKGNFIWKK